MCGCGYLNGWVAILGVQMFAMIGMLFSVATLGDCSFVELDERLFFPADMDENLPLKVTQTQYVGFLTWQMLDGSCYFYYDGSDRAGQLTEFVDILGRDWEITRIIAILSACLSFVYFCYLLSFTCSSQTRGVRYFNTVFSSVILTGLQGITFMSFGSDFCNDYGCTFSRSSGFCVASMACFFLSGLCFCCTTDYPGPRSNTKMPKLMVVAQVAPDQSRGPEPEVSQESQNIKDEEGRGSYIEEVMPDYEDEVLEDDGEEEVFDDEGEEEIIDDHGDDIVEEVIEVTDDEAGVEESVDGSQSDQAVDENNDFTEVTEEEVQVVETITNTDGSTTVTETTENVSYENRAPV